MLSRLPAVIRFPAISFFSGGPLFATDGSVLGVVFASAIDDPETGYALTGPQVSEAATVGSTATAEVGTGPCE